MARNKKTKKKKYVMYGMEFNASRKQMSNIKQQVQDMFNGEQYKAKFQNVNE